MCRTSQQEQPKCAPLMSSCGRPPAKSQRLALLNTPPPSSPMSPFLLPLLLSPLTPPPSLHSLPPSFSRPFVIFHHPSVFANLRPFSALHLNSSSLLGSCAEGYPVADGEEARNIIIKTDKKGRRKFSLFSFFLFVVLFVLSLCFLSPSVAPLLISAPRSASLCLCYSDTTHLSLSCWSLCTDSHQISSRWTNFTEMWSDRLCA